jgi:prevent-host-death family protein
MTRQYSVVEARSNFSRILHEVERGVRVEVTRRGKPVAVLSRAKAEKEVSRRGIEFWESLTRLRAEMAAEGCFLEDSDFEGLRDKSPGREVNL